MVASNRIATVIAVRLMCGRCGHTQTDAQNIRSVADNFADLAKSSCESCAVQGMVIEFVPAAYAQQFDGSAAGRFPQEQPSGETGDFSRRITEPPTRERFPERTEEVWITDHFDAFTDVGLRYGIIEETRITRISHGASTTLARGETWYRTVNGQTVRRCGERCYEIAAVHLPLTRRHR